MFLKSLVRLAIVAIAFVSIPKPVAAEQWGCLESCTVYCTAQAVLSGCPSVEACGAFFTGCMGSCMIVCAT